MTKTAFTEEKVREYKSKLRQKRDFYSGTDEEWQMAKARAYAESLELFDKVFES